MKLLLSFLAAGGLGLMAQTHQHAGAEQPDVALQPLAQQVRRLESALAAAGQPLGVKVQKALDDAIGMPQEAEAVRAIQDALGPLVLATVEINAESRVKVERGAAEPELVQGGSRFFLVKVINRAQVTARLDVTSPNSGRVFVVSHNDPKPEIVLSAADVRDKWAEISLYDKPPMDKRLSGVLVEYGIVEIYSRDSGQRSAEISFNVGQGSQDIGFRNDVRIAFRALPAHAIRLHIADENGRPTMASLTVRDRQGRLYPTPSKRLAPDLFFQPQVYRADGETLNLPDGYYTVAVTGGPEYRTHTRELEVRGSQPAELSFRLDRWIDPAKQSWYSGDHHVHAAGCSHYQNPTEGVLPSDMMRQIAGEKLNVGSVLTWGPDYYYQKQFFSGHDDPLSVENERMHYDLEVSGFPSSHAGHIVLLGLKEQDYPGTKKIEDWPTWDLPIFEWAKKQAAVTGFAHSGWGLQVTDTRLPSFEMPGFDGIGANEYIVDVTQPNAVDFLSAGDTPYVWELSIWYHTLNAGFRTRIAGETDFPCITDERVGQGRSYVKLDGPLTYSGWIEGLRAGRSYVSDGRSHLMNFAVNGVAAGVGASEVRLSEAGAVKVRVEVNALLNEAVASEIAKLPYDQKPYWSTERARIGQSRQVAVELIVNGKAVESKPVAADGQAHALEFETRIDRSSWVATRILPAAHTNPVFVLVKDKPVRASVESVDWCLRAVRQCWTQKSAHIKVNELAAAKTAYDHAEQTYRRLKAEAVNAAQ